MSSNAMLMNASIRHQVFLQRYGTKVLNDIKPTLEGMVADINRQLLSASDIQVIRLSSILNDVDDILKLNITELGEILAPQMRDLFEYEKEFNINMIEKAIQQSLPYTSPEQLMSVVEAYATPVALVSGDKVINTSITQIIEDFAGSKSRQLRGAISGAFVSGETTQQLVRRMNEEFGPEVKRQTEAIVRTSINHMADQARRTVVDNNADVMKGERWISTLDGRTSSVCRARDQQMFPIGSTVRPPAHFNCRSVMVPVVKDEYNLFGDGSTRASKDGQLPAGTTYNSWLKKQSKEFQDAVLGESRGKLFRSGGLHMNKFVDSSGVQYTLDELQILEPVAFERAGLS